MLFDRGHVFHLRFLVLLGFVCRRLHLLASDADGLGFDVAFRLLRFGLLGLDVPFLN